MKPTLHILFYIIDNWNVLTLFCNYFECFIIFIVPDPAFNIEIYYKIFITLSYLFIIWGTFFCHKAPFVFQMLKVLYGTICDPLCENRRTYLDKKVLLWHREAPLFLRVYDKGIRIKITLSESLDIVCGQIKLMRLQGVSINVQTRLFIGIQGAIKKF